MSLPLHRGAEQKYLMCPPESAVSLQLHLHVRRSVQILAPGGPVGGAVTVSFLHKICQTSKRAQQPQRSFYPETRATLMEGEVIPASSQPHCGFVKRFFYRSLALMRTGTFGYFLSNLLMWIFYAGSVNRSFCYNPYDCLWFSLCSHTAAVNSV